MADYNYLLSSLMIFIIYYMSFSCFVFLNIFILLDLFCCCCFFVFFVLGGARILQTKHISKIMSVSSDASFGFCKSCSAIGIAFTGRFNGCSRHFFFFFFFLLDLFCCCFFVLFCCCCFFGGARILQTKHISKIMSVSSDASFGFCKSCSAIGIAFTGRFNGCSRHAKTMIYNESFQQAGKLLGFCTGGINLMLHSCLRLYLPTISRLFSSCDVYFVSQTMTMIDVTLLCPRSNL